MPNLEILLNMTGYDQGQLGHQPMGKLQIKQKEVHPHLTEMGIASNSLNVSELETL